ncbi:MAG: hypothetical protein J5698_04870 [Bacteroidaceae bacterium]|nr:hypothetical protein [Bacteroidaceae bacterium]
MKAKYYFTALLALLVVATSCEDQSISQLDEVQLSSSYVTIDPNGGSQKITLTATEDWTFDYNVAVAADSLDDVKGKVKYNESVPQMQTEENSWITVSPMSGSKGTVEVTFSAGETTVSRSVTLQIKSGNHFQNVIVAQTMGATDVPMSTVQEVIDGPDSKTYRVTGTCSAIANTYYGNWYLKGEDGNTIYIYGTVDATGSYNWSSFNIALGDVVTVEGPKTTYNGTVELVDASVLKVKKALLLSDETSKTIGKEAAPFTISVTQKGKGIEFASGSDWLTMDNGYTVNSKGLYVFTIHPEENTTGKMRTGSITIKSTSGDDSTELPITVTQLGTTPDETGGLAAVSEALKESSSSRNPIEFDVVLKNAKVTYKNGSNTFIEDETGGLLIYSSDAGLSVGQVINGRVWGSGYAYNNLPEATVFGKDLAKVTSGDEPEPTVVTLADLAKDYDKYISRYVQVKGAEVASAIDVKYSKVASAGKVTDGTNEFALNHQSTGKYEGNKIYYYIQAAQGSKVDVTCIPSVYKTNNQLNIWEQAWITESK